MKVSKRDGSLQEFDRNKLKQSIIDAGTEQYLAEDVCKEIEGWIEESTAEQISSEQIRNKAIEVLNDTDPVTAENYRSYRESISE